MLNIFMGILLEESLKMYLHIDFLPPLFTEPTTPIEARVLPMKNKIMGPNIMFSKKIRSISKKLNF